jgi:hypothetical protein
MKNDIPFNVLRNPNSWDNVPRDPISAAVANAITGLSVGVTATATASAFAGATAAWWAVAAVSSIAISAVTGAVLGALAPKQAFDSSAINNSQGLLANAKGATTPQEFVYGEVRKGGPVTFIASTTTLTENDTLHQIIVLAGHEIEEVVDIYFDDQVVTMTNETVTSTPFYPNSYAYAKVYVHLGNQTSASDAFANSTSTLANTIQSECALPSEFIGEGLAYLYVRLLYNHNIFTNGVPTISARIKGKKVVTTSSGTEQTAAYTNNAAWCIRDFLTSHYGLNDDAIDYSTFEAAANICDDHLDGTTTDQYTINGVVRSDLQYGQVLQDMMTACAGTLYWGGGSWRLYVGNFVTPTKTLELKDFRGPISLDTRVSMRDNFNTVRGTYIDASTSGDFISADYPSQTHSDFLAEDNNVEIAMDLNLPFTTDEFAAQRLARQMLYRSREQMTIQADFGMNAFDIEVGDFIKVKNDRYGWGAGNEKVFECVGWRLQFGQDDGALLVNLTLRESSSTAFDWTGDPATIIRNNTTLPKYYEIPDVGLSISQEYRVVNENVTNAMVIDVTCSAPEQIDYVVVKYKKSTDTDFKSLGQSFLVDGNTDVARYEVNDIETPQLDEDPIEYTISVNAVNGYGFRGETFTTTFDIVADNVAPSSPSSLSHFLSGGTVFFTWPAVSDLDLSHYKLYYTSNTSHTFPGNKGVMDVKVAKIARPATSITWGALAGKWFVSAVDKTGNESTTAATTTVTASELPTLGTTDTDTEHTAFDGDKTDNITDTGSAIHMTTYSSLGSDGVYEFYHDGDGYMDAGTSRTIRVSYGVTYTRKHANAVSGEVNWDDIPNNWDSWPSNWDDWTDETSDYGDIDVLVQVASSTDNVTYSNYVDASGEVVGRYVKFRAVLSNSGANVTPLITALTGTLEY